MQAVVMDEVDEEAMEAFISDRVKEGAPVYTDGSHVYDGLWAGGFEHEAVIHSPGAVCRRVCRKAEYAGQRHYRADEIGRAEL